MSHEITYKDALRTADKIVAMLPREQWKVCDAELVALASRVRDLEKATLPRPAKGLKPIPVSAARRISEEFGYDQVVIVARKVGDAGGEHCTTYGRDKDNCDVAARIGDFFKHELMCWPRPSKEAK